MLIPWVDVVQQIWDISVGSGTVEDAEAGAWGSLSGG